MSQKKEMRNPIGSQRIRNKQHGVEHELSRTITNSYRFSGIIAREAVFRVKDGQNHTNCKENDIIMLVMLVNKAYMAIPLI